MFDMEGETYVNFSVLQLRDFLTESLVDFDENHRAWQMVRSLRDRCNDYLTAVPDPQQGPLGRRSATALKRLRESFKVHLQELASDYDLAEARDLARKIASGTDW